MQMDYQNAIDYVVSHPEVILQKAKKNGYICPCCGSGSGQHGTGITSQRNSRIAIPALPMTAFQEQMFLVL